MTSLRAQPLQHGEVSQSRLQILFNRHQSRATDLVWVSDEGRPRLVEVCSRHMTAGFPGEAHECSVCAAERAADGSRERQRFFAMVAALNER